MIVYFADRQMHILGQASTSLPQGLTVIDDLMTVDVETGTAIFECKIPYDNATRHDVAACTEVGNYLLLSGDGENEFYQIIDSETDTKKQQVYLYAEDEGMDLLNEIVGEYEADQAYPISHYINKFTASSGFVIGVNEAADLTRKLSFDSEQTAQERILSVARQFDGCEIEFSFDVDRLLVVRKYINIHKKRGEDTGINLRLNYEIDSIVTTKSIANLATALLCTGGTPEKEDNPITLSGYAYDDGDFYVEGGILKSREALKRWARLLWKDDAGNQKSGGHITKTFSYDTLSQSELCSRAVAELKKICDTEINYEADIVAFPANVKAGDRVNIIDDNGELYFSARLLTIERSIANNTNKAVLGEYLIKDSGIRQKVIDLAAQFAKNSQSAVRALAIANTAQTTANDAKTQADTALENAFAAQSAADTAQTEASNAVQSAQAAQTAANNAQSAVDNVKKNVTELETSVANAQAAAEQAQQAAETAEIKATEAQTAATDAQTAANNAATAAATAQTTADTAVSNAASAQSTADAAKANAAAAATTAAAAKADAEAAQADIDSLGDDLTTLSNTMTADYARKTDLTEATSTLQTQISQNAADITSHAKQITTIDETANNAATQAAAAQTASVAAQTKADKAATEATAAQTAANNAASEAAKAQSEANNAKTAALTAQSVADKAKADLEAAQADLATVQERVDATEEDITAAQTAVAAAQKAADAAQADATAAKQAADAAQADVDDLAVRVTTAETNITQNAEAIELRATKTEVTQTLGGYYTKTETEAAITTSANSIKTEVSEAYATKEETKDISDDVATNSGNIAYASSKIEQIVQAISMLVTGENGESLMTQTETGWVFNFASFQKALNDATSNINDLTVDTGALNGKIDTMNQSIADLGVYTDYIKFGVDNGKPCIILGETDSAFKVVITNTDIRFMEGSTTPASISNETLNIEKAAINEELRQGGFSWMARSNGNYGLVWRG